MKFLTILLAGMIFMASCTKTNDPEMGVGIRVINQSNTDFDSIILQLDTGMENYHEILFTNIRAGNTSDPKYLDQLVYVHYEENTDWIYFTNFVSGVTSNNTLLGTGYGFCGTGLVWQSVTEGDLILTITGVDLENKVLFMEQRFDF
jgi:hypothetical protein